MIKEKIKQILDEQQSTKEKTIHSNLTKSGEFIARDIFFKQNIQLVVSDYEKIIGQLYSELPYLDTRKYNLFKITLENYRNIINVIPKTLKSLTIGYDHKVTKKMIELIKNLHECIKKISNSKVRYNMKKTIDLKPILDNAFLVLFYIEEDYYTFDEDHDNLLSNI